MPVINNEKHRTVKGYMWLEQIGLIYSVETIADEEGASNERRAQLRQKLADPIIRVQEAWALNEQDAVIPKSPIGKAIGYLLGHIRQLSRYATDGR